MIQVWRIGINNIYTEETYFVEEPSEDEITTPITVGCVKAKWDGMAWTEGATVQEIQDWEDSQVVGSILPTQDERIDMLENMLLMIMEG